MNLKYLLLIITVFLLSCADKQNQESNQNLSPDIVTNPVTASGNTLEGKEPKISFTETAYDFGKIVQGEKVNYSFKFKNTGTSDLIITNASASCGCTVPEYSKEPIAPGKDGVIKVEFNSEGKTGIQNKTVTVITNTNPNSHELIISGEIIAK